METITGVGIMKNAVYWRKPLSLGRVSYVLPVQFLRSCKPMPVSI
jgi:hypothetical protein